MIESHCTAAACANKRRRIATAYTTDYLGRWSQRRK